MGSTPGAFGETEIATQRLLLTPLRPEDAEPMAGVLADQRLHEFIGGSPASAPELRSRYGRLAAGSPGPDETWLNWIVRVRATGEPVGTVQATVIRRGADARHRRRRGGRGLGELVSEADQAVITGDFADYLAASFRAALSTGIAGWRDDDLAFTRDWGISLEALGHATPVAIWQGDQDRMVPAAHGGWLAANIPLARPRLRPGEGHLSLMVSGFGEILDDLLGLAGKSRPSGAVSSP